MSERMLGRIGVAGIASRSIVDGSTEAIGNAVKSVADFLLFIL